VVVDPQPQVGLRVIFIDVTSRSYATRDTVSPPMGNNGVPREASSSNRIRRKWTQARFLLFPGTEFESKCCCRDDNEWPKQGLANTGRQSCPLDRQQKIEHRYSLSSCLTASVTSVRNVTSKVCWCKCWQKPPPSRRRQQAMEQRNLTKS